MCQLSIKSFSWQANFTMNWLQIEYGALLSMILHPGWSCLRQEKLTSMTSAQCKTTKSWHWSIKAGSDSAGSIPKKKSYSRVRLKRDSCPRLLLYAKALPTGTETLLTLSIWNAISRKVSTWTRLQALPSLDASQIHNSTCTHIRERTFVDTSGRTMSTIWGSGSRKTILRLLCLSQTRSLTTFTGVLSG